MEHRKEADVSQQRDRELAIWSYTGQQLLIRRVLLTLMVLVGGLVFGLLVVRTHLAAGGEEAGTGPDRHLRLVPLKVSSDSPEYLRRHSGPRCLWGA